MTGRSSAAFSRFARSTSRITGRPGTFLGAVLIILVWAATGPGFHYSDTWQLVINTGTTIVTFLMVFLIQNTQNRDSEAMHVKLDELIRAVEGAHNRMLDLEDLDEDELDKLRAAYVRLGESARADVQRGDIDTGVCEIEELEDLKEAVEDRVEELKNEVGRKRAGG